MIEQHHLQSPEHLISLRVAACVSLFRLLAWVFSYPSKTEAEEIVSKEFFDLCTQLIDEAGLEQMMLSDASRVFADSFDKKTSLNIKDYRIEFTRLFISPPPRISLEGYTWIKNRSDVSKRHGEKFAVSQDYRQLGLKMKADAKDPYDHLTSELDYMSYVANAEAQAWDAGDIASAREWRALGRSFMQDHLVDMAKGVSAETMRLSENVVIRFCAALLFTICTTGFYETEELSESAVE